MENVGEEMETNESTEDHNGNWRKKKWKEGMVTILQNPKTFKSPPLLSPAHYTSIVADQRKFVFQK